MPCIELGGTSCRASIGHLLATRQIGVRYAHDRLRLNAWADSGYCWTGRVFPVRHFDERQRVGGAWSKPVRAVLGGVMYVRGGETGVMFIQAVCLVHLISQASASPGGC